MLAHIAHIPLEPLLLAPPFVIVIRAIVRERRRTEPMETTHA